MKKMKNGFSVILLIAFVLILNISSFAGTWQQDTVGWWYQSDDGSYPKENWKQIDNTWYYFDTNGYMKTGWIQSGNKWYYCNLNGSLATNGWIGEYYVGEDGAMLVNTTTPDGEKVDSKGIKISYLNSILYDDFIDEFSEKTIREYRQEYDGISDSQIESFMERSGIMTISKIQNGKIYGEYRSGYGESNESDFKNGVPIQNNIFKITMHFDEGGRSGAVVMGERESIEDDFLVTCMLDYEDGKPIIVLNGESNKFSPENGKKVMEFSDKILKKIR